MKKKILMCLACCVLLIPVLSGCTDYEDTEIALGDVRVENILPKVSEQNDFLSLEDIDEFVYQQHIAACIMFKDACELTRYELYLPESSKKKDKDAPMTRQEKKVVNLATQRRHIIYDDIDIAFAVNIYRLLQNVEDCPNTDAYVLKAQSDVKDFFDDYDKYLNGENPEDALLDILTEFRVRSNVLAFTFLDKNKTEVCRAAVKRIAENSKQTEDLRVYVSENNEIIKSLNEIYGSVPTQYANSITSDANFLAKKLVLSLESLSQKEKVDLINQIDPTPSPTPTSTPTPTPTPTPKVSQTPAPTPRVTQTPRVTATPRPVATPTPIVIEDPVATPAPPLVFE